MSLKSIVTSQSPAAIGPYSQGIEINGMVFVSGQLPIDPKAGKITSEDISVQARQSINNVLSILEESQLSARDVVKTTIFLKRIEDFDIVNAIYAETFGTAPCPARSLVQVAALPKQALIEIECIAAR